MTNSASKIVSGVLRRSESALILAVLLVVALTILLDPQRNYWNNPHASIYEILRQTSMLGIFALGSAIVIIAGGIDLSAGSMIAFGGAICATFLLLLAPMEMKANEPLGTGVFCVAIFGTIVVGFLVGSLHAWLITVVGLPPFIATLATLQGLRSFSRVMVQEVTEHVFESQNTQIYIYDEQIKALAQPVRLPGLGISVPCPLIIFLALVLLAWLLMSRTIVGRHLYALGGNEAATRLSGIRTDRLKWLAYCLGSMLSALVGILYMCDQGVADPQTLGRGYELNSITAAVVGGCSLQGGVGTIPGVVLGCLFLRVVLDGIAKVIKSGADAYEGMIVGTVLVIAVAFSHLRGRQFFPGALGLVTVINLAGLLGVLTALHSSVNQGLVVGLIALVVLVGVKCFEWQRNRKIARGN
jgi:ribose/xylose/arabinose/galactoside ABC-type transport system permease subunit